MKKKYSIFLIPLVIFTLFTACAKEKKEVQPPKSSGGFRTINTRNSHQEASVVCHNCTAKFKVSMKMMKSGSVITCPVCHHDYSHKASE